MLTIPDNSIKKIFIGHYFHFKLESHAQIIYLSKHLFLFSLPLISCVNNCPHLFHFSQFTCTNMPQDKLEQIQTCDIDFSPSTYPPNYPPLSSPKRPIEILI